MPHGSGSTLRGQNIGRLYIFLGYLKIEATEERHHELPLLCRFTFSTLLPASSLSAHSCHVMRFQCYGRRAGRGSRDFLEPREWRQ